MLKKQVKRLPVVDADGKLVGVLSRVDVFHTILRECPDWQAFQKQQIAVDLRFVSDIMRRDTSAVLSDTPVEEVMRLIDCNDIQRVCVVDEEGHFLGLISDRDLLAGFSDRSSGIWDFLVSKISSAERGRLGQDFRAKTAGEVMNANIVTVQEDAPINEAIRLMLGKGHQTLACGRCAGKIQRHDQPRCPVARRFCLQPQPQLRETPLTATTGWFIWALFSAVFAALTAIFAKIGLEGVDSDLATLIRTVVILLVLAGFVYYTGKYSNPFDLHPKTWLFLVLSGLATGASWVCYFRALKVGEASKVAPVDKLSLLLVALFAVMFLGERPAAREWVGILFVGLGVIILALKR